jgi:hypothetical protein
MPTQTISQKRKILLLLRHSPEREITCLILAKNHLYHKAASRISELRRNGYDIRFNRAKRPLQSRYKMWFDKDLDPDRRRHSRKGTDKGTNT